MINKVGAFTSFGGDLKTVIVGNMVPPTYFDAMPNTENKKVLQQERMKNARLLKLITYQ